jgi:hypothetical protein
MSYLQNDFPYWNRTSGCDHVMFYGRMSDDGSVHRRPDFTNMTFISVESKSTICEIFFSFRSESGALSRK